MQNDQTTDGLFEIDLSRMEHYEAIALVLTLLAYPGHARSPALDQRFGEICAYVLHNRADADPTWSEALQRIRPMHALIPFNRAAVAGRALDENLGKRLDAGRMAIAFIDQTVFGAAARLPKGVKRLSLNEMAMWVSPEKHGNLETRAFRPSRPVLHFCVALAWLNLLAARLGIQAGPVDAIIKDKDTFKRFLELAESLEGPVLASPSLGVEYLHRVRLRQVHQNLGR